MFVIPHTLPWSPWFLKSMSQDWAYQVRHLRLKKTKTKNNQIKRFQQAIIQLLSLLPWLP